MSTATKDGGRKRNRTAYGTLTEERLRAVLDADLAKDGIVSVRSSLICRKHYALLLGASATGLQRFRSVFAEYEQKHEILSGQAQLYAEMIAWLHKAYNAREFQLRGEKLDRSAFTQHFGVNTDYFKRPKNPVGALFRNLDARAKSEGYLPLTTEKELERLRSTLASGEVLNRDRKTVSLKKLASATRIKPHEFIRSPFAEVIAAHQAAVMIKVKACKIDPYFHDCVFVFSDLSDMWSILFLERVGVRFKQIYAGLSASSPQTPHRKLLAALKWVGASSNPHCRKVVSEANKHGRILSASDWEDALYAYRDHTIEMV